MPFLFTRRSLPLLLILVSSSATAREPMDFLRIQEAANRSGVEAAWRELPAGDDLSLELQRFQLELARKGPSGLHALAQQRDGVAARLAELIAALDLSDVARADSAYARLGDLKPDGVAGLQWRLLQARAEITLRAREKAPRADSLLTLLEQDPLLREQPRLREWTAPQTDFLRAILRFVRGEREPAVEQLLAAAERAEVDGWPLESAWMRCQIARLLRELGRRDEAQEQFERSAELAERVGDRRSWAAAASWVAYLHERGRRFRECYELEREVAPLLLEQGDLMGALYSHLSWGWAANHVGEYEEAIQRYDEAAAIADRLGNAWGRAQSRLNLGWAWMEGGEEERAVRSFEAAAQIARDNANVVQEADVLNGLASAQLRWGRPDLAAESYRRLADLHRERGDLERELTMLSNLALALRTMGNLDAAIALMRGVQQRSDELGMAPDVGDINLASWLYAAGRRGQAEQLLRSIRDASQDGDVRRDYEAGWVHARWQMDLGQFAEAAQELERLDRLNERRGERRVRVGVLTRLASAQWSSGQFAAARASLDLAESIQRELDPTQLVTITVDRAVLEIAAGRVAEALDFARSAARSLSLHLPDAEPRAVDARYQAFDRLLTVAIAAAEQLQGEERARLVEESFMWLQRLKARSLLDCVRGSAQELRPQVDPQLAAAERQANRALEAIQSQLLRDELSGSARDSLRSEHERAQAVWASAHARVLAEDERFRMASSVPPPRIEELRASALAQPGNVVLDYFISRLESGYRRRSALFVLHEGGVELYPLPDALELNEKIELALGLLNEPTPGVDAGLMAKALESAGRILLAPAAGELQAARQLIVVPDGLLSAVPFAALRWEGSYLVERWPIQTSPSLPVLAALHARGSAQSSAASPALLVWESGAEGGEVLRPEQRRGAPAEEPLRYAPIERSLLLGGYRDALWVRGEEGGDDTATEQLFARPEFEHAGILHFIAHGYFDELQPWRSALYLDPGRGEASRRLAARDVYRLDLQAEHVTLSACETARIPGARGRGLEGLAQAFFVAGCRSILATQWAVDDRSTARLMDSFYRGLATGHSRSEALRAAQLELLQGESSAHPFYWAPFVLLGDGSQGFPLQRSTPASARPLALFLGAAFVLALTWRLRRLRKAV